MSSSPSAQREQQEAKLRAATPHRMDRDRGVVRDSNDRSPRSSGSGDPKRRRVSPPASAPPAPSMPSSSSFPRKLESDARAAAAAAPAFPRPLSLQPMLGRKQLPLSVPRPPRAKGVDCVRLHAAYTPDDFHSPGEGVKPLFVHHFFPNDSLILPYGWVKPKCQIFYHPPTLNMCIKIIKDEQDEGDEVRLRNILSGHAEQCEDVLGIDMMSEADFLKLLKKKQHPPVLDKELIIADWPTDEPSAPSEITAVQMSRFGHGSDKDQDKLRDIWHRIEYLMHWYIESQGHIGPDTAWRLYFAHDENKVISAVSSVYEFHAMPKMRHRVGNFLVLPHCQRKGVGTHLLEKVYLQVLDDDEVMEMTVEDPSIGFCALRDVMYLLAGVRRGLWSADTLMGKSDQASVDLDKLRKLKIPLRQAHRLADMVELASVTAPMNLDARIVLNADFCKQVRLRFKRVTNASLLKGAECTAQQRKTELQRLWTETSTEYVRAIAKMRKQLHILKFPDA